MKSFKSFGQSAVIAGNEVDAITKCSVIAEKMKLLANISYGYQIMDRSRHIITKWNMKTHEANINKMFGQSGSINGQLYEVDLVNSEIEHKGRIIVGFFLQSAKLRLLKVYFDFFDKYSDVAKFEELEVDIDSL